MKLKIKKLNEKATIPSIAHVGDAGMDLTATEIEYNTRTNTICYKTGLAIEIPDGYVGLIFPRSSIYKTVLRLSNSVGVIDSGYRGEIMLTFMNTFNPIEDIYEQKQQFPKEFYQVGDRVGQLIIMKIPQIEVEKVDELSDTSRGEGGFGSTGK